MPTFVLQVVVRSEDKGKSLRVLSRWPYEAADLEAACAFVDATPDFDGWHDANTFEVLNTSSELLATRPLSDRGAWDVRRD